MPRFFHGGSDSESSSSDEEELYSDREEQEQASDEGEEESSEEESSSEDDDVDVSSDDEPGLTGASRFMKDAQESDESDDEERVTVVKSAKDKRFDELEGTVKLIENAKKIHDWAVISTGTVQKLSGQAMETLVLFFCACC